MQEFLDVRFIFICRTTYKNEKGKYPIVLRVIFNGERRDLFTGLYCSVKDWNSDEDKVMRTGKEATAINRNLEQIRFFVAFCSLNLLIE